MLLFCLNFSIWLFLSYVNILHIRTFVSCCFIKSQSCAETIFNCSCLIIVKDRQTSSAPPLRFYSCCCCFCFFFSYVFNIYVIKILILLFVVVFILHFCMFIRGLHFKCFSGLIFYNFFIIIIIIICTLFFFCFYL